MRRQPFLLFIGAILVGGASFVAGRVTSDGATSPSSDPLRSAGAESKESATISGPVIGIASLASDNYVRAIRESGGIPVVLPDTDGSPERIEEYLELLDGLVMPGGADIPPSEWGEEPHPTTKVLDDDRYRFEKALIHAWIERSDKPLLGICLGSQWINVAHGGSLVQDIPSEFGVNHRYVTHPVKLEPDSRLGRIYGETDFEVNSVHHQAVCDLGEGLRIVANSPEGIVEATETTDPDRFLIGVQWHPEKVFSEDPRQRKLFQAFVEACSEHSEEQNAEAGASKTGRADRREATAGAHP